ncbi:hypothetical protein DW651_17170 [Subdoligranulum sp. AM23-21AC]|nr:hypothetical protein DW651_17170 [Subdoligranulum sp. AM23-21AC]
MSIATPHAQTDTLLQKMRCPLTNSTVLTGWSLQITTYLPMFIIKARKNFYCSMALSSPLAGDHAFMSTFFGIIPFLHFPLTKKYHFPIQKKRFQCFKA